MGTVIEMPIDSSDADDSIPLEARLPPCVVASPSQANVPATDEPRWWRPGWEDVRQYVGWRWILLIPAILVLGGVPLGFYYFHPLFPALVSVGFKLSLLLVGAGASVVGYVTRRALRARREPFCIFCGYNLSGLPDEYRCPECGREYTWAVIAEYRKDPNWFIERWKLSHRLPATSKPIDSGPVRRRKRAKDGTE